MQVGGQAVIEGVMMRNKENFAVAVRLPDGRIKVKKEKSRKFPKIFTYFFIRGVVGLIFTLYDGVRALTWSGNQQLEEEEQATPLQHTLTLIGSFVFALLIFVGIPFLAAQWLTSGGFWFDLLDGVIRMALFIGYIALISLMDDVKVLFQYHGAEHKSIACYEANKPLTPQEAQKCTRFHPRCGTSFVLLVLILSVFVFSLLHGPWWVELGGRILLLPVIAGLGFELIKMSARYAKNPIVKAIVAPGLWLQRLTTKEPTEKQLAVAIVALQHVLK